MLYAVAHFLRDKMPWVWDLVDIVNSWLFSLRFGRRISKVESDVLAHYEKECGMRIVRMWTVPVERLAAFFAAQPEDAFTFFKPHGSDASALRNFRGIREGYT